MSFHEDRDRADSFGAKAEAYERYRPSYPAELIDWLTSGGAGTAVDVGCGTGQVAQLLVAAGWQVVGVEADERMAERARARGLDAQVARFEDWDPTVSDVDLVCSGQAWHWIDPRRGFEKAADLLRPGGRLAIFWNLYRHEPSAAAAIESVYERLAPELLVNGVPLGTARIDNPSISLPSSVADRFGATEWREFTQTRRQSVDDWLGDLATHSIHEHVDPSLTATIFGDLRAALVGATDGTMEVTYLTVAGATVRS